MALQELCPEAAEAIEDLMYLNIYPTHDDEDAGVEVGRGVAPAAAAGDRNRELLPRPYEVMFHPKWQPLRLGLELGNSGYVTMAWYDECIERKVVEGLLAAFERAYRMLVDGWSGLWLKDIR